MSLERLKNILPQSQLSCVYYGLVESHLRYGDVVRGSLNKSKTIALQRIQNWACCIIENAKIDDNWSRSWLNVENTIRNDRDIMTYKIMNKLCPEKFFNKFLPRSSISKYHTRHFRDLQIPRYRIEFAKKDFITQPWKLGIIYLMLSYVSYLPEIASKNNWKHLKG